MYGTYVYVCICFILFYVQVGTYVCISLQLLNYDCFRAGDDDITVLGSNNEGNNNQPSDCKQRSLESGNPNLSDTKGNIDSCDEDYFMTDTNAADIDTTDELPSTQANTGITYSQHIHT